MGDGDPAIHATIGYLELRPGEFEVQPGVKSLLPIRAVWCRKFPGVKIASVYCWERYRFGKEEPADG